MQLIKLPFILLFPLVVLFFLCSKEYNPYSDLNNCSMDISRKTFTTSDTLTIFSTEIISVLLTAPGLADSLIIEAPGNRYFENGVRTYKSPGGGPHEVPFSFWDTGLVNVNFTLERKNGDPQYIPLTFYVKSPLENSVVCGGFDTSKLQIFKTVGVKDSGITYQWIFGKFKQIDQIYADTTGLFIDGISDTGSGYISVTDGKFISPSSLFRYTFEDTKAPEVKFLDGGELRGDTIICSEDSFYKIIKISDPGSGKILEVKINDQSEIEKEKIIKKFSSDIGKIIIYLKDGSLKENDTTLYYNVRVDSTRQKKGSNLQFKILYPKAIDTINDRVTNVFTQVECLDKRSLAHKIKIKANNTIVDSADLAKNYYSLECFKVPLLQRSNVITALLFRIGDSSVVDSAEVFALYDSAYKKDEKPVIADVQFANTRSVREFIIAVTDSVEVRVIAYDDKGKVRNVSINNNSLINESKSFEWSGKIAVASNNNQHTFIVTDSAGQEKDTIFRIIKNRNPVFMNSIKRTVQIVAGSTYSEKLIVSDPDGNEIHFQIIDKNNKEILIDKNGIVTWLTKATDINKNGYLFNFSASDDYSEVIDSVKIFVFSDSSEFIMPVKFKTVAPNLPLLLESGNEYRCKLELQKSNDSVSFEIQSGLDSLHMKGDTLVIKPQQSDTGYHKIIIVAFNRMYESDTQYADFTIVPSNRKPEFNDSAFYYDGKPGIVIKGIIDSFVVFPLNIKDPDQLDTVFEITNSSRFSNVKVSLKSNRYYEMKLFNKNNLSGNDTIVLYCKDHGGLEDTLVIPVQYVRIQPVESVQPIDGQNILGDTIVFSWKRPDIGNDIQYSLQIDTGGISERKGLKDTTISIPFQKSGTYRWRVVANYGNDTAAGEWKTFTIRVPGHVQFKTTENEFKNYCFAGIDTFKMQLEIQEGTGSLENCFYAIAKKQLKSDSIQIPISKSGKIEWVPGEADTGSYQLNVFVTDSNKNSDTLSTKFIIVTASSCILHLSCKDPALFYDKEVDLYGGTTETDLMIVLEKSAISVFDTFNIRVNSNRYSVDLNADSVKITLRKPDVQLVDDTLKIVVRNKNSNITPVYEKVVVRYTVPERNITFNTSALNMNRGISEMPVLLRLDSTKIGFGKRCGFRFLKTNRTDTLKYQLTSWNQQRKTAEVWVLFDTITASGNNDCIMQYGYQLNDQSDGKTVFDTLNNFRCVYHFEEKGLSVTDATGEANNGTFSNQNFEKISNAVSGSGIFMQEASRNKLVAMKTIEFSPGEEKTLVFETWLKYFQGVSNSMAFFSVQVDSLLQYCLLDESGCIKPYYEYKDTLGIMTTDKGDTNVSLPASGAWNRISFIVSFAEEKMFCKIYSNGGLLSTDTLLPPTTARWEKSKFVLGAKFDGGFSNGYYDETWISEGMRSDDWFKFAYENQKQASTLIQIHY